MSGMYATAPQFQPTGNPFVANPNDLPGNGTPLNPQMGKSFDMKGMLANFAMGQAMNMMNPHPKPVAPPPQHVMGLQIPNFQRSPMYNPALRGRLYG